MGYILILARNSVDGMSLVRMIHVAAREHGSVTSPDAEQEAHGPGSSAESGAILCAEHLIGVVYHWGKYDIFYLAQIYSI